MDAESVGIATAAMIRPISRALGFYNRELDQVVPWKMYERTVKDLDRYEYSKESGQLVGEVKALMMDIQGNYFASTESVSEWCSLTTKLMAPYLDLFNKSSAKTFEAQMMFFIKMLNDAAAKISAAQVTLEQSSVNFNNVAAKLTTLNTQLTKDFDSKSDYFKIRMDQMRMKGVVPAEKIIPTLHHELAEILNFFVGFKVSIDRTNVAVKSVSTKLRTEIEMIMDAKSTMSTPETVAADGMDKFRYAVEATIYNLVAQCNEYLQRHKAAE